MTPIFKGHKIRLLEFLANAAVLLLCPTFGVFLGLDGQQGHNGHNQSDGPCDSRGKVLDPKGINVPNQQIDDKGPFDAFDIGEPVIAIGKLHGGNNGKQSDESLGVGEDAKHSDGDRKENHGILGVTALHDYKAFCGVQQGGNRRRIRAEYEGGQAQKQIFNKLINKNPLRVFTPAAQSQQDRRHKGNNISDDTVICHKDSSQQ